MSQPKRGAEEGGGGEEEEEEEEEEEQQQQQQRQENVSARPPGYTRGSPAILPVIHPFPRPVSFLLLFPLPSGSPISMRLASSLGQRPARQPDWAGAETDARFTLDASGPSPWVTTEYRV
ncbi:hypothetical protein BO71DRAFT_101674 [Aspergillus ellipticus CBS 707.79]|uniref:Uncharacterized protein n=1 Tax=Aspergillus ellipticus CBS 707.79 TaxID=1448320 RepID=A0A319DJT0_9EURO|nr:hypothetical protein BO71DRAFT_101674 [Aspergillus ellipticus CBS 707.79]